jgi:hypothetical protein
VTGPRPRSAEWIEEAPSTCSGSICRVLPLARFSSVTFSAGTATGGTHAGAISDRAWTATPIFLVPGNRHVLFPGGPAHKHRGSRSTAGIVTGPISASGTSFTMWWRPDPVVPAGAST